MYTRLYSQTIHSFTLDVDQGPVKKGQFTIPFSTSFPGLVFNIQSSSLEIIGDMYSSLNKNHQMMSTAGLFSDVANSLFNSDYLFEVGYSDNVGTLVFSGDGHSGSSQVYIITQNSDWNTIESSDKYLNPFQIPNSPESTNYYSFGVVEQEDKIYLIGGYSVGYQNTVQMLKGDGNNVIFKKSLGPVGYRLRKKNVRENKFKISHTSHPPSNLQDVNSLQEAQTRQWIFMANLKTSVYAPAVVYSNDQLLVVGYTGSSGTCQDVQYLNLASNTTGVYARSIDCGTNSGFRYPGMYNIVGGNVSIFGGYKASESCIQQTASGNDLDTWECLSGSETSLEGLGYSGGGSSHYIRYSNFVV